MNPEIRLHALSVANAVALEALADEILAGGIDVVVTAGPESVSAPVRMPIPGSDGGTTVLGHVALTRCTVLADGTRGDGLRMGYDLPGAVAAAICDAECERGGRFSEHINMLCQTALDSEAVRRSERAKLVAMTTVDAP